MRRLMTAALLAVVPLNTVVMTQPASAVYCEISVDEQGRVTIEGPVAACLACQAASIVAGQLGEEVHCPA